MNPKRIKGAWNDGYTLDVHTTGSQFIGHDQYGHARFETSRSELGEALYRLKYSRDRSQIEAITTKAATFVQEWGIEPDLIVPVPATRYRTLQPTAVLGEALAEKLGIPFDNSSLKRTAKAKELKGVYDPEERKNLLDGSFQIVGSGLEDRSVLLLDDLYRSGATLNEAASLVRDPGGATEVYALAPTRTRSNR
jgi:predicted amidophosphoribosyltransferase